MNQSHILTQFKRVSADDGIETWLCSETKTAFVCYASDKIKPKYCPYCGKLLEETESHPIPVVHHTVFTIDVPEEK